MAIKYPQPTNEVLLAIQKQYKEQGQDIEIDVLRKCALGGLIMVEICKAAQRGDESYLLDFEALSYLADFVEVSGYATALKTLC